MDNLVLINPTKSYESQLHCQFLSSYRTIVNQDIVYMNINTINRNTIERHQENGDRHYNPTQHPNNLYLCGFSEQVFHCLANICNGGGCASQVTAVENIDKKYNLPLSKATNLQRVSERNLATFYKELDGQQEWRKLKVFISSTFEVDFYAHRLLRKICFVLLYTIGIE